MAKIQWTVDGIAMPRNPDNFEVNYDKANVNYVVNCDGSQTRVQAPKLICGADFVLYWSNSDRRLLNFIMQFHNPNYSSYVDPVHKILVDGIVPAQEALVYFDSPKKTYSKEVFTQKLGEGGMRQDLVLTLRMKDPFLRSVGLVPMGSSVAASSVAPFVGPTGTPNDNLPEWQGHAWTVPVATTGASTSAIIENLGTAYWQPTMRISGPFGSLTAQAGYADVDGTGMGVGFTWTGPMIPSGDYLLFDTAQRRCWQVHAGVKSEVYTFEVITIADGFPYSFYPALNPGLNLFSFSAVSATANTTVDFSNGGTEQFPYW